MSGIFGVFNRNAKPVDKEIVNTMLDAMSYWGPDDSGRWINGPVALGHTMLWNTPESKLEHLPSKQDHLVITMDARLDNREELAEKLEMQDRPMEQITDSDFILAAYREWGSDCPKYLLGDFAFVIWDEKKQQLFCARDHIGIKLFHYYLSDELFVFSNDIIGVLSHKDVPGDYDNKTISLFLRDQGVHTKRSTFFEKLKKLPAATTLVVTADSVIEKEYWRIEDSPSISYDTYAEYVQRLKELFDSAVEARLRTDYPVTSHLSGGIDSSPIAVLAARKLKKKHQPLYVYNWINIPGKEDNYEYESWKFSRRIAEDDNIVHKEFSITPEEMASFYDTFDVTTKGTMFYWGEYFIQDRAKKMNARTIMSGWGGDELISHNGYGYESGLFWQGKVVEAFQYLYREKRERQYSWFRFARRCVREILYPIVYKLMERNNEIYDSDDYAYIKKDFIKVMKKYDFKELPFVPGVRKGQYTFFHHGHLQARVESWAMSAFSNKTEYSYPLLDKRIVEFAMGIPEHMFAVKEGHRRFLWRKSIEGFLPHDIAWFGKYAETRINRTKKKYYGESLRVWYEKHKDEEHCLTYSPYINYVKIMSKIKSFDFEHADSHILLKVVVALLILNRSSDQVRK